MGIIRNFIADMAMVIFSVVLVLAACEIGLRTYVEIKEGKSDSQNEIKSYEIHAGSDKTYTDSGRVYGYRPNSERLETNSWGFRDREFDLTKEEGEKRIIMLGDSITAATELHRNETVSSFLETALQQTADSNYTVYNLGITGYNVSQSLATLKEVGLKLSPDIVVYNLCFNDSDPVLRQNQHGLIVTAEISAFSDINIRTIVGSSYVLTFLKNRLINLLGNIDPDIVRKLNNPQLIINKRVGERAWSAMKAEIQKLRELAEENDARFLVTIYPYASQIGRPVSELLPQQDLGIFFNSSGIAFIDLTDVYTTAERNMFVDSAVHLNAYGTERIARTLAMGIVSMDGKE